MEQHAKLSNYHGELLLDLSQYRRLIGKLLYLTLTRPDIAFSAHQLRKPISFATKTTYLQATHRVLRYLQRSLGQGLLFSTNLDLHLKGYCDSDWASCQIPEGQLQGNVSSWVNLSFLVSLRNNIQSLGPLQSLRTDPWQL